MKFEQTEDSIRSLVAGMKDPAICEQKWIDFLDIYGSRLIVLFHKSGMRVEEAKDAIQEVCLKVLENIPDFEYLGKAYFESWLFRIARNTMVDFYRSLYREDRLLDRLTELEEKEMEWPLNFEKKPSGVTPKRWPEVLKVIHAMDPRVRKILFLKFYSDCSYSEISTLLETPKGTIKSLVSRTLAELRSAIKDPTDPTNKTILMEDNTWQ